MHDWAGFDCYDGFWSRWAVAQCTVWSLGVVVFPTFFDQDLSFTQAVENFAVKQIITEPGIEAFTVAVFQGKPSAM